MSMAMSQSHGQIPATHTYSYEINWIIIDLQLEHVSIYLSVTAMLVHNLALYT